MIAEQEIIPSPHLAQNNPPQVNSQNHLDSQKSEAFAGQMLSIINAAALALMTSIGHRTALFDAMAGLPPATSEEIAVAAELDERYVREWLGAMTTGRIVEHHPRTGTYFLPPEHAAWLTRAASPNNLAVTTQFISLLGAVEDKIVECFAHGGGVPYSAYPRFHEIMAQESRQTIAAALLDSILPLMPDVVSELGSGINVLDIGCGSGHSLNVMAEAFPASTFTGYDFSEEGIAAARDEAEAMKLSNVRFEVQDLAAMNEPRRYDLITAFDVIHDQAEPGKVLWRVADALRPGGTFLMQDIRASSHVHGNFDNALAPFIYTISCLHCMTVSLAQGGKGLGAAWGEERARQMLADAGFRNVEVHRLPHDIMNNYYVVKKN